MQTIPEPHPLDYDWRFTEESVEKLASIVSNGKPMLVVGCPSLARQLERTGVSVTLVDRQPFKFVESQISQELGKDTSFVSGFRTAVIDPPWYPDVLLCWLAWTANCVGVGGTVFASIWPQFTRPTSEHEFGEVTSWLQTWASVSELDFVPEYDPPLFEEISIDASNTGAMAASPRVGRLLRVDVGKLPSVPVFNSGDAVWIRFLFNDYQIAVRQKKGVSSSQSIMPVEGAIGWIWPFVSRRAPNRNKIDLWSSRNEVAVVQGTQDIIEALRKLGEAQNANEFDELLTSFPMLKLWNIPRPPYWRKHEWTHRQ